MSKKRPKRAGRPPKPDDERFDQVFQFKMLKAQLAKYRRAAKARGMGLGTWMRLACDKFAEAKTVEVE